MLVLLRSLKEKVLYISENMRGACEEGRGRTNRYKARLDDEKTLPNVPTHYSQSYPVPYSEQVRREELG